MEPASQDIHDTGYFSSQEESEDSASVIIKEYPGEKIEINSDSDYVSSEEVKVKYETEPEEILVKKEFKMPPKEENSDSEEKAKRDEE